MASFYSPSAEWGLLVPLTEESEDRVCGRFGSSYAHGQQERLDSAELETMRMSRNPTTVMTANSEKKRQCMSIRKILLVKVISWNSSSSFLGDTLWKIMGIHLTGRAVKNHISSEMASELITIYRTYVPFVVRGSSAISSSPALSLLLSSSSTLLITLCPKEKGGRPTARCKPEKKRRFLSKNWTFVNVMLLEETTAVLPFGKLCEVWKEIIHTSHFLVFACTHNSVAHDIRSRWLTASRHPCFMCSVWFDLSSTLHFALFTVPLIFFVIVLIFIFIFHVGVGYTPLERGSWVNLPLDQRSKTTSHRKWEEDQVQYFALRTTRCPLYQRVLLRHLHLPIQHLQRRILWSARKIPQQKEVEVWSKSAVKPVA